MTHFSRCIQTAMKDGVGVDDIKRMITAYRVVCMLPSALRYRRDDCIAAIIRDGLYKRAELAFLVAISTHVNDLHRVLDVGLCQSDMEYLFSLVEREDHLERLLMHAGSFSAYNAYHARILNRPLIFAYELATDIPVEDRSLSYDDKCAKYGLDSTILFGAMYNWAGDERILSPIQIAAKYGFVLRLHDLLLVGADPRECLSVTIDPRVLPLVKAALRPWSPNTHAYVFDEGVQRCARALCTLIVLNPSILPLELIYLLLGFVSRGMKSSGRVVRTLGMVEALSEWRARYLCM